MIDNDLESFTSEDVAGLLKDNIDAVIVVDSSVNRYRALLRRNIFKECIDETGDYEDMMHKLWFHKSDSNEQISDEYSVFVSYFGKYKGKYSRKIKVFAGDSDSPCGSYDDRCGSL